jgi:beta-alanine--pyruvate transaminase
VACAAGLAALDIFEREGMVGRVRALAPHFETGLHALQGLRHVSDIRNFGLAGALQIEARGKDPLRRPYEIALRCWERGFYVRWGGDTVQLGPPFVAEKSDLDALFNTLHDVIPTVA